MKVSRSDIQKIYQDQVRKTKLEKPSEDFGKILKETSGENAVPKAVQTPDSGNVAGQVTAGKPAVRADPVETLKFAAEVVASQPDIREEKVARIKALFDKGQYNVSPEDVADRLINDPYGRRHLFTPWEG